MKTIIASLALLFILSSCSVIMAARKEGVDIRQVQATHTRGQLLACGPCVTIVASERLNTGELIETYQIQAARGSAARAFMHGVLDVSTCGLWEVIGTPIEACADQREYYALRIYYDCNEVIQKIELL